VGGIRDQRSESRVQEGSRRPCCLTYYWTQKAGDRVGGIRGKEIKYQRIEIRVKGARGQQGNRGESRGDMCVGFFPPPLLM
jgi:hypothetical protein